MSTTDNTIPEAELAERLNLQRSIFTAWRKDGKLKYPTHFFTKGRGEIHLTEAGIQEVSRLLGHGETALLTQEPARPVSKARAMVLTLSANPRRLMGRLVIGKGTKATGGDRIIIQLVSTRVFSRHFRKGMIIEVEPTHESAVYQFTGKAPKKQKI